MKIVIVIAAIVVLIYAYQKIRPYNHSSNNIPFSVKTEQVEPAQSPSGLPADLPVDPGSKVLQNYESRTTDNRRQSTKQITTRKAPAEAITFYIDFFKKSGWQGGITEDPLTAQLASDIGDLLIVVREDNGQTTVEFTLTQSPIKSKK